ncbi:MAG: ribonuclease HII [Acidobacteria bacterium]|nr:MAG: ribonuclease HII [Acidobacteriota bacterium]TDI47991.1 MAG: ribonuclease HII [Acidobacteriota bacterium]
MVMMSVSAIRARWFADPAQPVPADVLRDLSTDPRRGVQSLLARARRQAGRNRQRRQRAVELLRHEKPLWRRGLTRIAGIDEAGMGPLAGPVIAAAVILPPGSILPGLDDSKVLTRRQREAMFVQLQGLALGIGVGRAEPAEVDRLNIYQAGLLAMTRAVAALPQAPDYLLLDARSLPDLAIPQESLIGGDRRSASIAAASVVAKVTRDGLMAQYEKDYPGYGFKRHKGYPTADHRRALLRLGPTPIHRRTFTVTPPPVGQRPPLPPWEPS